jgi:hypothetical protein
MLIVFLLRKTLSETIKLSGASRRHVALHPAAILAHHVHPERDHSIEGMQTTSPGYRDLHLVDAVANRMIIAAACDCWFGVPAAATD